MSSSSESSYVNVSSSETEATFSSASSQDHGLTDWSGHATDHSNAGTIRSTSSAELAQEVKDYNQLSASDPDSDRNDEPVMTIEGEEVFEQFFNVPFEPPVFHAPHLGRYAQEENDAHLGDTEIESDEKVIDQPIFGVPDDEWTRHNPWRSIPMQEWELDWYAPTSAEEAIHAQPAPEPPVQDEDAEMDLNGPPSDADNEIPPTGADNPGQDSDVEMDLNGDSSGSDLF